MNNESLFNSPLSYAGKKTLTYLAVNAIDGYCKNECHILVLIIEVEIRPGRILLSHD